MSRLVRFHMFGVQRASFARRFGMLLRLDGAQKTRAALQITGSAVSAQRAGLPSDPSRLSDRLAGSPAALFPIG